jgi:hypothetical protein
LPYDRLAALEFDRGWEKLVTDLDKELVRLFPNYVINQAKEKFGGLRYYVGLPRENYTDEEYNKKWDEAYKLIDRAEATSYSICEACGFLAARTRHNNHGWLRTLCHDCALDQGYLEEA